MMFQRSNKKYDQRSNIILLNGLYQTVLFLAKGEKSVIFPSQACSRLRFEETALHSMYYNDENELGTAI